MMFLCDILVLSYASNSIDKVSFPVLFYLPYIYDIQDCSSIRISVCVTTFILLGESFIQ